MILRISLLELLNSSASFWENIKDFFKKFLMFLFVVFGHVKREDIPIKFCPLSFIIFTGTVFT